VSGPHSFAVRLSAVRFARRAIAHEVHLALRPRLARQRSRVHRIPSRVRDDARSAPLVGTGWLHKPVICAELKIKYFYAQIWTAQISMKSLGKFDFWRNVFQPETLRQADRPRYDLPR
jgi:hypothetical protein